MKSSLGLNTALVVWVLGWLLTPAVFAIDRNDLIGTWEGESKCTVSSSPCHDEHVIYEIVGDKRKKDIFKIDAYKLVNGQRELMGTVDCTLPAGSDTLSCTSHSDKQDIWEFKIANGHMDGTLVIGAGKQLFRKVSVDKHAP
jgi:hypothetical protein